MADVTRYVVAESDGAGRWQQRCRVEWRRLAGFSMPLPEGTAERDQVEGACRFLAEEPAAEWCDLECGLRVSRA